MNIEEAKLKIQALIDNELSDEDVREVLGQIEGSYELREEYVSLLKLQRKMKGMQFPEPQKDWFEGLDKKKPRLFSSILGKLLFFGSYIVLLGYSLYTFLSSDDENLLVKILVAGIIIGVITLLGVTVADRMRESKTDKYKGVMK